MDVNNQLYVSCACDAEKRGHTTQEYGLHGPQGQGGNVDGDIKKLLRRKFGICKTKRYSTTHQHKFKQSH
jgi:hypothetical protein